MAPLPPQREAAPGRGLFSALLLAAACLCLAPDVLAQTVTLGTGEDFAAGTLVGRVCEDLDGNASCGAREPGIAHARVVLSDGTFAITDGEGRYHLAAVPPRQTERVDGSVREAYGRLLVKLDVRSLGARALVQGGEKRVVEFGPAALHVVDFAVAFLATREQALTVEPGGARGQANGLHRFLVRGRSQPGHSIWVEGEPAKVERGAFSREVGLRPGENLLALSDLSPEGALVFYRQKVSVVLRPSGGVLFIPGALEQVASVSLPRADHAPAATFEVRLHAAPGTRATVAGRRVEVDSTGEGRVPMTLRRGTNAVALELAPPGGPLLQRRVELRATGPSFTSALAGVELAYDFERRELVTTGRGTASLQRAWGDLDLLAGVDLDVGDVETAAGWRQGLTGERLEAEPMVLLRPRPPFAIERELDPERQVPETGDEGLSGSWNPSRSRFWALARHPRYGEARLGSFHTALGGAQVGTYERSLFGGQVDARLPAGPVTLEAKAFGSPAASDLGESNPLAAHDEFSGTGGSLFYLRNAEVVPGSEKLRVQVREGAIGMPVEERTLVRHADYEIDYLSGRILLSRPLPINLGQGPLLTTPLQGRRPWLVADYEVRSVAGARGTVAGGRAGAQYGELAGVRASAVQENRFDGAAGDYRLLSANGRLKVGPVALSADVAQSEGTLFAGSGASAGFSLSDTAGFSFLTAPAVLRAEGATASAFGLSASLGDDRSGARLWARAGEPGFSDSSHASPARFRQLGAQGTTTLGRFELTALADDRVVADPRDPFGTETIGGRDALLRARVPFERLALTVEGRAATLEMADVLGGTPEDGGRASLGARLDYRLVPELSVNASHLQRVYHFGSSPASLDDTFTAVGADYRPKGDLGVSVRGGWGPGVGTQVQLGAERAGESEVAFGSYTVDLDGPDGQRVAVVSGARQQVEERSELFVEDLFARDPNALRMGRAVGVRYVPAERLQLTGRYERGVRLPFTGEPALLRDTGSGRASWFVAGMRLSALAEVRHERGDAVTETDVERWQSLGSLALEARPWTPVGLLGRLTASKTRNHARTEAQLLEGFLGASLRLDPWVVLLSYSLVNEIPQEETLRPRELTHFVSVRPAVNLGDRFRVGAGLHAAFPRAGGPSTLLAASVRPSVRVVGDLELAVEGARRSAAPDGEELNAFRAEVAWWVAQTVGIGVGYNLYGFSGTGLDRRTESSQRVYLRLEAAY